MRKICFVANIMQREIKVKRIEDFLTALSGGAERRKGLTKRRAGDERSVQSELSVRKWRRGARRTALQQNLSSPAYSQWFQYSRNPGWNSKKNPFFAIPRQRRKNVWSGDKNINLMRFLRFFVSLLKTPLELYIIWWYIPRIQISTVRQIKNRMGSEKKLRNIALHYFL